jgi:hypothetical protein
VDRLEAQMVDQKVDRLEAQMVDQKGAGFEIRRGREAGLMGEEAVLLP